MIIETTISTPQFERGRIKDYTVQEGTISDITWRFEPKYHISGSVGKHNVQFHSRKEWEKARIK